MTAPAQARRGSSDSRIYVWPPAPQPTELYVPSVTTILKQLSKGNVLTNWAAKQVAEFAVENILSWQDLPADAAIDLLKRSPYRDMTRAGDRGTAVHAAIEAWNGGVPTVDPDLLPYVGGAVAFMEEHVAQLVEAEKTVYSRQYQYAGTFDAIVQLKDGRVALCDWKTSKGIYPETALQLAGYANAEFIGGDDGTERPLPALDLGMVVHLPGNGNYAAREVELTPRLWKTFQALRTLQRWKDDYEQDALGKTHKGPRKEPIEQKTDSTQRQSKTKEK